MRSILLLLLVPCKLIVWQNDPQCDLMAAWQRSDVPRSHW